MNKTNKFSPEVRERSVSMVREHRGECRWLWADVVVDIGASDVEELLALMHRYRGSHGDLDHFIVPTVPTGKQQQDTVATLAELSRLGISADKVRLVFNMVQNGTDRERVFDPVLAFLRVSPVARVSLDCRLGTNENERCRESFGHGPRSTDRRGHWRSGEVA